MSALEAKQGGNACTSAMRICGSSLLLIKRKTTWENMGGYCLKAEPADDPTAVIVHLKIAA